MDEFLELLLDQTELYRSLLSVLREEKAAITESSLETLNNKIIQKEALILKIQKLEDRRLRMLDRLGDSLDYPAQDLTLKKISLLAEEPYSSRLGICRSNLLSLTEKAREVNHINESLLAHSIELVRGSMSMLNNFMGFNAVYYRTGKIQNNEKNGRVFSDEI